MVIPIRVLLTGSQDYRIIAAKSAFLHLGLSRHIRITGYHYSLQIAISQSPTYSTHLRNSIRMFAPPLRYGTGIA